MSYLLDTHVWRRLATTPAEIAPHALDELAAPAGELLLSPISVWEYLLLVERGRLAGDLPVEELLRTSAVTSAPLSFAVAAASRRITLPHRDPADRFIAATAQVHGLTLVTADRVLIDHAPGQYAVLAAC